MPNVVAGNDIFVVPSLCSKLPDMVKIQQLKRSPTWARSSDTLDYWLQIQSSFEREDRDFNVCVEYTTTTLSQKRRRP